MRIALRLISGAVATVAITFTPGSIQAQTDSVIRRMWEVGIEQSQTRELAQVLLDSIGPRLAGSPNLANAQEWLLGLYESWGIPARKEQYGTWNGWQQGILHVDMVAPRAQTLEAHLLAWSPATDGPVEGEVIALPALAKEGDPENWLPSVAGKWVLADVPEQMCRAAQELERWARPETVQRINEERRAATRAWRATLQRIGRSIVGRIEEAGALGMLSSRWSRGWGVNKVFSASTDRTPHVDLSCEDYGLLYRMAERGQRPRVRIEAQSEFLGI